MAGPPKAETELSRKFARTPANGKRPCRATADFAWTKLGKEMKPQYKGIKRFRRAVRFSLAGLRAAWRHEPAFRQECCVGLVLTPLAFWVGETLVQAALLIGAYALVLIAELFNSAIEATVDRAGLEPHDLARRAKDIASAAVAVALVLLAVVWALTAAQRLL